MVASLVRIHLISLLDLFVKWGALTFAGYLVKDFGIISSWEKCE